MYMKQVILSLAVFMSSLIVFGQGDYDSIYLVRNCVILDAKESVQEEREDLIYKWNFGDGDEGHGEIVEHCYDSLGMYDVILSIIDPTVVSLFQNEWIFQVTITEDYQLSFGLSQSELTVAVRSNLTYDEKPEAVSYYWDFGDGVFEYGDEVAHTYNAPGEYDVRLLSEVTNENDIINLSKTITIKIE